MKNAKIIFLMLMILSCTKPAKTYIVSLSSNPPAAGIMRGGGEYKAGSSVTVTAEANSGYTFTNWIDVSNGKVITTDKSYTFSISDKTILSARFAPTATDTLIALIAEQENFGMQVIPNYGTNVPQDKLQVLTRYIGDIFLIQGISVAQSGAVTQSGKTDMVINTKDLENRGLYKPIVGGGPHIWISKKFSSEIHPWSKLNNELILQMYAEVPNVILTDFQGNTASYGFDADKAPVTQLSFGIYLKDKTSQKTFAYIICVYESRGTYQESAKNNDTFTNFTSTPLESTSRYITKSPLSASLQSKPFSGQKFFKVHINEKNLLKAILDTGDGMSTNLADYQITSAGVLFELPNYVNGGHNTSQVNVSKLTAFIQQSQK